MIAGWEDFFTAVEVMRQYQKEYFRTQNPFTLQQCRRKETEIDACIEHRRQKQAGTKQIDLPLGG